VTVMVFASASRSLSLSPLSFTVTDIAVTVTNIVTVTDTSTVTDIATVTAPAQRTAGVTEWVSPPPLNGTRG